MGDLNQYTFQMRAGLQETRCTRARLIHTKRRDEEEKREERGRKRRGEGRGRKRGRSGE